MATYLVTCATGQQGRAVVKHLLASGAKVHAVVRDPLKETARQLESQGIVLFRGDNDDFPVFRKAAEGCDGLYLNLQLYPDDPQRQGRQAHGIIKACKDAGVQTIVVSTAFFTGDRSKWDNEAGEKSGLREYYASKADMEKEVRDAGVENYTILRPAWFHGNYLLPYSRWHFPTLATDNELAHAYDPGVKMAHIDEDDIGKYAAAALMNPDKFRGQEIELGSESLTIEEAASILSKVSGRNITTKKRTPDEVVTAVNTVPTQPFHLLANKVSFELDGELIEDRYGIHLTRFENYFLREKDRLLASLKV